MSIAAAVESGKRIVATSFLDRCVLLSEELVSDGAGGQTTTYLPWLTDVPCRFAQLTETDIRVVTGMAVGAATGILQVSVELEVPEGTFVQETARENGFWLVVGDRTPSSATAFVRRLLIREVTWAG